MSRSKLFEAQNIFRMLRVLLQPVVFFFIEFWFVLLSFGLLVVGGYVAISERDCLVGLETKILFKLVE